MRIRNPAAGYHQFLEHLLSGDLVAGEVITQKALCDILDTSISPLRETLVLMEELELIEVKARSGIKIVYPDITFMRENMELRTLLEKSAIPGFMEVVSDSWIDKTIKEHVAMKERYESGTEEVKPETGIRAMDRQFHRDIIESLDNHLMAKTHERTQSKLQLARHVHKRKPRRRVNIEAIEEHLAILEGFKNRDVDQVNQALHIHFTTSFNRMINGI